MNNGTIFIIGLLLGGCIFAPLFGLWIGNIIKRRLSKPLRPGDKNGK